MDLAEQARKDPRVGDKWESSQGIVEIKDVNENFVFAEWSNDKGEPARHLRTLWPNIVAPWWTLAARGPAPATPERDPKKDPRAGDKFEARGRQWSDEVVHRDENSVFTRRCISGFFHSEKDISIDDWPEYVKHDIVVFIAPEVRERDPYTTPVVGDEWECVGSNDFYIVKQPRAKAVGYVLKTCLGNEYPHEVDYESFAALSKQWRLHRRGDDPAWRPEGEQPAAGIKVGDRVRFNSGAEGDVVDIVNGEIHVLPDETLIEQFDLHEWQKKLTIIPPASTPDQDDTGDEPPTLDVVTNANGARQSRLDVRCDLLPPKATLRISAILRQGAERYGDTNYLGISTADHLNHALTHVLQYLAGDVSEDHLGNAAARMLFALETKGSK